MRTSEQTARTVAALAWDSFQHHRLTYDERRGHWLCRSPKTGSYWFGLYVAPGMVVIWGDVAECVLRHNDRDSLEWLLRAVGTHQYPDYCLGKISAQTEPKREFFPGDALLYIQERLAETIDAAGDVDEPDRKRWLAVEDTYREGLDGWRESERSAWFEACAENDIDDPPDCEGWSSSSLWSWHALSTFVRLMQTPTQGAQAAHNLAAAYHPWRRRE